jgi:hypothetical protein
VDLSNAQIELQTTSGPVQFYFQAGAYSLPAVGSSYVRAGRSNSLLFGPLPVAYVKLAPSADVTVQVGALPTLIGAEYTFTFQNTNIERGLLWTQEPAISKGVEINYSHGPVLLQGSLNDGFDSGRYNWISGLAAYTFDAANSVTIDAGANLGRTAVSTYLTPLAQNNSGIFNVSYTYSKGPLTINPYLQYTAVSAKPAFGIVSSAKTYSGAVLAKYSFTSAFSLAARAEYIDSAAGGCAIGGGGVADAHPHLSEGRGLRPGRVFPHRHRPPDAGRRLRIDRDGEDPRSRAGRDRRAVLSDRSRPKLNLNIPEQSR